MWTPRIYLILFGITIFIISIYILLLSLCNDFDQGEEEQPISILGESSNIRSVHETWPRKDWSSLEKSISQVEIVNKQNLSDNSKKHKNNHVLKQLLATQGDISTFDFKSCRMSNCFDFARCNVDGPIKVHIIQSLPFGSNELNLTGEGNIIHRKILKIIRDSKYYEPDFTKACLFILEDDTIDRDPLSQSFNSFSTNILQSKYNYGMNHIMFNLYSGSWPDYREDDFAGLSTGAAILAKASNSIVHHRTNFDISLPLFSYLHGSLNRTNLSIDPPTEQTRKYFLTFKGKRYVVGTGSGARNSLYHLNNGRDVIMLTTCRHGKNWHDAKDSRCMKEEMNYNSHDFDELMRESTFCLTPRGRRLGSFRFLEALGFGCIPVVISDGWVWPFDELIDWSQAAIQINEKLILLVPDMLRDIELSRINEMRFNCRTLYANYFSTIEKIVITTLDIIERRIKNHAQIIERPITSNDKKL